MANVVALVLLAALASTRRIGVHAALTALLAVLYVAGFFVPGVGA